MRKPLRRSSAKQLTSVHNIVLCAGKTSRRLGLEVLTCRVDFITAIRRSRPCPYDVSRRNEEEMYRRRRCERRKRVEERLRRLGRLHCNSALRCTYTYRVDSPRSAAFGRAISIRPREERKPEKAPQKDVRYFSTNARRIPLSDKPDKRVFYDLFYSTHPLWVFTKSYAVPCPDELKTRRKKVVFFLFRI